MRKRCSWIGLLIFMFACREPYVSPISGSAPSYLVVDGFIQTNGDANVVLSRTRSLDDSLPASPEPNAVVELLIDNSWTLQFADAGGGKYLFPNFDLGDGHIFQLHIRTFDGKEYLSDTLTPKTSPPIDSVNWVLDPSGVNVYVNTHDPLNNTKYYKWEYQETWEHRAHDQSLLIFQNNSLTPRSNADQIFQCWRTDTLTDILVGTTEKLAQDVVYQQPIKFIANGADEISNLYSIMVYQYAISKDAYQYWTNLKKNTELRGTLFDPQPSQVNGNMRCLSNPDEPVIGFISAGSVSNQRIFINNRDLAHWNYTYPYECNALDIPLGNANAYLSDTLLYVPLYINLGLVHTTSVECGDCRYTGGSPVKPSFFP